MLHRPAVPSSPEPPSSMGRKRTQNHDLPPRMARKGASYYYVSNDKPRRWIPLGADLARAKRRWAELDAGAPPAELSVADLVQRYIDREDRAPNTQRAYRSNHRAIEKAFAIPAAQLTSQHVALWRELQPHRKRYANACITLLTCAFAVGAEQGLCQTLSVKGWKTGGRDRDLLPAEFRAIRACARPWLTVAMDLGYLTGARPVDLRALRWEQVGADGIDLRQIKTKTRQTFTMNADLQSVLARAKERPILGLYVVANDRGRPIGDSMFREAWRAACAAAGVTNAQFRDIRAMAAKQAEADGLDFQALLGHTTRAMSERYLKGRRTIKAEPVRAKL